MADLSNGLVIAPSSMGSGTPTTISSGKFFLDLRASGFSLYTLNITVPVLSVDAANGGLVSGAFISGSSNPANAGAVRLAKGDTIYFRDETNNINIPAIAKDTSERIGVGTSNGVILFGPLVCAGAVTGVTALAASGQITSTLATGTAPFAITSTTVVPNLNVATLNGVTVSGAPTTGQSLVATGATTAAWSGSAGVYKVESAQYTPSTVSNSAAATNMMTFTLPANELTLGQAIRLTATGTCANASGGALNFLLRFMLGATSLCATTGTGASIANGATNGSAGGMWSIEALLICTAVGSSGTLEAQWVNGRIGANNFAVVPFNANTATIAINTTTTNVLATNITMAAADPSTTCTQRQMLIERLG